MYNESRKKWFLEENATERNWGMIFGKTEKYEMLYDEDACDWSIAQILGFYKRESSRSIYTIKNLHYALNVYCDFCKNNNLVKNYQNNYENITTEMLMSCVNIGALKNGIVTREELIDKISEFSNPSDKFIFLALFEGIRGFNGEDILYAKTSQIEGNIMHLHSGKDVVISDELKMYAFESADEWQYDPETGVVKMRKLIGDPDDIIKRRPNCRNMSKFHHNFFPQRIKNVMDKHGMQYMSSKTIYDSGVIHFMREELKKYEISAKEYFKDQKLSKNLVERCGGINNTINFLNKYSEYLN